MQAYYWLISYIIQCAIYLGGMLSPLYMSNRKRFQFTENTHITRVF